MTKGKLIPILLLSGILLSGCKNDGEIKGIHRWIPETTTSTSNPYLKPPSQGNGTASDPNSITRTTISPDTEECQGEDKGDQEADVYEEFCE